ncbi:hypothetical protein XarjCFBP7653_10860 [Xanthomonas arboricola]|nr:hypothetical protein XarjCFBP7653_10860 [Xanthomonas arboricola]
MPVYLSRHVSYCLIDNQPLFLDTLKDHYFQLPAALEAAFLAHVQGDRSASSAVTRLVALDVLAEADAGGGNLAPTCAAAPDHSAIESAGINVHAGLRTTLDVAGTVFATWRQLKRFPLHTVLEATSAYRERHLTGRITAALPPAQVDLGLREAAEAFRHARLRIPCATRCLPDAISLIRFLARRGLHANLVFGVMVNPLSAHCWVQAHRTVLSDTVGNARAHTPILVV